MGILARISLARALSVEGQTPLRPPRGPHFRQRAFLLCQLSHLRRLVVSRVARASQPTRLPLPLPLRAQIRGSAPAGTASRLHGRLVLRPQLLVPRLLMSILTSPAALVCGQAPTRATCHLWMAATRG